MKKTIITCEVCGNRTSGPADSFDDLSSDTGGTVYAEKSVPSVSGGTAGGAYRMVDRLECGNASGHYGLS